jgi:hypothetical protein
MRSKCRFDRLLEATRNEELMSILLRCLETERVADIEREFAVLFQTATLDEDQCADIRTSVDSKCHSE